MRTLCAKSVRHHMNAFKHSKQVGRYSFAGNGGSAADAQHLAAELSARYYHDRQPLNAEALHVNGSYLTATANDYDYKSHFRASDYGQRT